MLLAEKILEVVVENLLAVNMSWQRDEKSFPVEPPEEPNWW